MSNARPLHIGIVGGAFTGNMGAQAMLTVCVQQMRKRFPDCVVHVLSYYPEADTQRLNELGVYAHSCTPLRLVANWLPVALALRLLPWTRREMTARNGLGFRQLASLDAVLDVAGVAYIDGREKYLPFNVLTSLPFTMHRVAFFKMAQAMGPITSLPNRVAARLALTGMDRIFARGRMTAAHVEQALLGRARLDRAADVAFLLPSSRLSKPFRQRRRRIGVVASSLVMSKNNQYVPVLARTCVALRQEGWEVTLIAHSWRSNTTRLRNNDVPALRAIAEFDPALNDLPCLGNGMDAGELKAEIGECRIVVTSRFHGMIAALGVATPPVVIGWSHKYREVMEAFGLESYCLLHQELTAEALLGAIRQLDANAESTSESIAQAAERAKRESRRQFDLVEETLKRRVSL